MDDSGVDVKSHGAAAAFELIREAQSEGAFSGPLPLANSSLDDIIFLSLALALALVLFHNGGVDDADESRLGLVDLNNVLTFRLVDCDNLLTFRLVDHENILSLSLSLNSLSLGSLSILNLDESKGKLGAELEEFGKVFLKVEIIGHGGTKLDSLGERNRGKGSGEGFHYFLLYIFD